MKERICALLLALCLSAGLSTAALAAPFSDVPAGTWYSAAVNEVTDAKLMNGTAEGLFSPEAHVTRGMVAVVLWRLAKSPAPKAAAPFSDVNAWYFYADAVAWAAENGIASGYGNGTFGGGDTVTREQLALFLFHYARHVGAETAVGKLEIFPDADKVHSWAVEGMAHAVGLGLIAGRDDGALAPLGSATRAQLAVILQRLMTPAVG